MHNDHDIKSHDIKSHDMMNHDIMNHDRVGCCLGMYCTYITERLGILGKLMI